MAIAVFADDFIANVLHPGAQLILTVRALSVERSDDDGWCVSKWLVAVFALYLQVAVLRMNPQFFVAAGAADIMTFGRRSGYHGKLRQGFEQRNLYTVLRKFRI